MDKQSDLISRLQDEADLCRNEGASDIAALLDEATEALRLQRVVLAELALKTGELIEHLQKTGRLAPCFYMTALTDARAVLAEKGYIRAQVAPGVWADVPRKYNAN